MLCPIHACFRFPSSYVFMLDILCYSLTHITDGQLFFFQAEDGIRDAQESRGLGDVYKRQVSTQSTGTALFKPETMANMSLHLETLLQAISANPSLKLSEYDILPADEREQLLVTWNDTDMDFPEDKIIPQLFAVSYTHLTLPTKRIV
eukprot:TRINITY_DN51443_c0_g1_i2.p1 TRINITY_DN51443_c0_g1~~TRINITY_DN51443_c0_g1_i2.p1  ORF type:complete len:148 (+),score=38.46 TRINITY_DN51443_c0_g1_i2:22-465(+)